MVHPDLKEPSYPQRMLSTGLAALADTTGAVCLETGLAIEVSKGPVRKGFWVCRCGKRCAVVYRKPVSGRLWLCRDCSGWRYASAALHSNGNGRYQRLKLQYERIAKIIGTFGLHRPPRMRLKTWAALDDQLDIVKEAMKATAMRDKGGAADQQMRALECMLDLYRV